MACSRACRARVRGNNHPGLGDANKPVLDPAESNDDVAPKPTRILVFFAFPLDADVKSPVNVVPAIPKPFKSDVKGRPVA
jgi:hypothetical protein